MNRTLNHREKKALRALRLWSKSFHCKGELPAGIGTKTLTALVESGLVETGPSRFEWQIGYRITPDGISAYDGLH